MNQECPVCYNENEKMVKFNECCHKVCTICCQQLIYKAITLCPLCRGIIELEVLTTKNGNKFITDNYYNFVKEREEVVNNDDTDSDDE